GLRRLGFETVNDDYFDTLCIQAGANRDSLLESARAAGINLRALGADRICIALDETATETDLARVLAIFNGGRDAGFRFVEDVLASTDARYDERFKRATPFLTHPVFNTHRSETELLRYMNKLQSRDLSLVHSMIPLGSCTMKL